MRFLNVTGWLTAIASVAAIVSLSSTSARADAPVTIYIGMTAQDVSVLSRARPEFDPKGIPLGGFRLFPTLDVTGTYDDNVFRLPAAQSDIFVAITPTLRLRSQWGRHFLELYADSSSYEFTKFTAQNLTDWRGGLDGRLDISHSATFAVNVFHGEFHELWSSPNTVAGFQAEPNRYRQNHADFTATYKPSRLGLEIGGGYDRSDWMRTPTIGGGSQDNSDRNESEYQGYGKLSYEFSPGYSGFVRASYDDRQFDHYFDRSGQHRSSHGYRFDGGVDLQITHLLAGEVFAGYLQQYFAQDVPEPLQNLSGIDYGAQLDWYATPLITVHLNGSRHLTDVTIRGTSVSDDNRFQLSADYEFHRNIIFQAYGTYTISKLVGTPRTDNYPGAGVGVRYLMNRYASILANYAYSERTSVIAGTGYTDDLVSVRLALHI